MTEEGIWKEFDPLMGSEKTTAQANRPNNSELVTSNADAATNVLDEFDPLSLEKSAKKQYLGQIPSISETSLHSVNSSSQVSTSHEHPSAMKQFNLAHTNKLENIQLRTIAPKDKQPVLTGANDQRRSDQIGAEIHQIDSVLKALNMGQFDLSSLIVDPTTQAQSMQMSMSDQAKQAEAMPAANHSTGLRLIGQLGSGDSGSSSDSEDSSSDSSDDSLDLTRELREVNDSGSDGEPVSTRGRKLDSQTFPMSKGEVDYRTLPLPERCDIPFPEGGGTLMPIGRVSHLAEKLVVIHALPGTPPFDEGTVVWSKEKKSIARIFETFGPVKSPVYSVLVESHDHASSLGLTPGVLVYVVPSNMELTKYIFTQQLMKQKGSDASWKDDHEVPTQFQDYSDDESEQAANKGKQQGGKRGRQRSAGQSFQPIPHNSGSNPLNVHHGVYPLNPAAVLRPPAYWGYGRQSGPSMHMPSHPSYSSMPYPDYQALPPPPH